jgi:GntR family transcriptional regulator
MKQLHSDSATPLHAQVSQSLIDDISVGKYVYGDKIPSEPELCKKYDVSRITIRKAVENLQTKGILIKQIGKGTFVAYPKIIEDANAGGSFTRSCLLINAVPSTKVISITKSKISRTFSEKIINVFSKDQEIICVERIRLANGIPVIFEVDYFYGHQTYIMDADLENEPLMDIISSNSGIVADSFEEMFDVEFANKKVAEILNCPKSTPLLKINQKVLTINEELVYYNEQYIRQDLYKYVVRSKR